MAYHALDETTLIDHLRSRPAVVQRFTRGAQLSVKEAGDGNLNLVFIVSNRDEPGQAVIAKQALHYLRAAGESWPLTRERMRFESQAMQACNRLCPGLVPEIYYYTFLARSLFFTSDFFLPAVQKKEMQARFINPYMNKLQADFVYTNTSISSPPMQKRRSRMIALTPGSHFCIVCIYT